MIEKIQQYNINENPAPARKPVMSLVNGTFNENACCMDQSAKISRNEITIYTLAWRYMAG